MKIQILNPIYDQPIEGFVQLEDLRKLDDVCCDSEAELILAPHVLSDHPLESYGVILSQLLNKVRLGGELIFGGIEMDALADHISEHSMSINDASTIIQRCQSVARVNDVANSAQPVMNNLTWAVRGVTYEFRFKRG